MKLRQQPEDFQVEERTATIPAGQGSFALYRLEKTGWTTPDALAAVRRRWRIEPRRLSYGGLKDRHARTIQFFTILHGPQRNLTHHTIAVKYLGQVPEPYTSHDIAANRFQLTLRALSAEALEDARQGLEEVRADGVPNYFDDQRFGSVGYGREFIARPLVLGQYEDALKLALAAPYEFDRAPQKQEKAILRERWGDWAACKERLPRGHARSLVDYLLHHSGDFRGAIARLRPDLRGLYLSAYQSHLWNRMLARWLREHLPPEQLVNVRLKLGEVPFHRRLDDDRRRELEALRLPLPSGRMKTDPDDPQLALAESVLAEEGVTTEQMKLKGFRDLFFSKGDRAGLCLPSDLTWEAHPDERHAGRSKLVLSFDLPRGCYATLIVKRITAKERPAAGA